MPSDSIPGGATDSAFWMSLAIIFVSEIGDKTFMIAVVMAMRHARAVILAASLGALWIMTVLSAALGYALPNLISRQLTLALSGILFIIFAGKMLLEAREMTGSESQEELDEVQREISEKEESEKTALLESGNGGSHMGSTSTRSASSSITSGINNLLNLLFSPIFVQTFVMVFLAEWGDRSQLATIALAGSQGFFWVALGALIGHSVCTIGAVWGGSLIATKISVKTVTIIGAVLFLIFGIGSLIEAVYFENEDFDP